jgi:hypothetical protein
MQRTLSSIQVREHVQKPKVSRLFLADQYQLFFYSQSLFLTVKLVTQLLSCADMKEWSGQYVDMKARG